MPPSKRRLILMKRKRFRRSTSGHGGAGVANLLLENGLNLLLEYTLPDHPVVLILE
ncbi:hypothetical protein LCGC14_2891220 [marine sediment metagenome]|uniref:Uncharacterized protein n=1 Tax=marine sediment metagenome TaxID=412755 RepID=A0A0F9A539_9ZZZZ